MAFLLLANLTFQKQLVASSASHMWLAHLTYSERSQMVWGLEHKRYEDSLRNLGWFSCAEAR